MKKTVDNKKVRFSDALWAHQLQEIIVGGVGGIGSYVAFFLSRIGHTLHLYDMDVIDETNLGGQLYSINQIGSRKVDATLANIQLFSGASNVNVYDKYDKDSLVSPIMFSCFDSMEARKTMFNNWKQDEDRELFVDGRNLAEVGHVFVVQKGQEEEYEKYLFEDSDIEDVPCSFKATSHCSALIASLMVSGMNNYLTNKSSGFDDRVVPFITNFELPIFSLISKEL